VADRLPGVPFLNGGLFDEDEFSPAPARVEESPPLRITNATFARIFDELLEAFNFTVTEDTPLDQDVAVDPEMLGKVFESIVLHAEAADPTATAPDKRKATGSYYTPRIVVHFICREALRQYLMNHLGGKDWGERLKGIMDVEPTDGLGAEEMEKLRHLLPPEEGVALAETLKDLKCCDPAVGSGAFPVGLMHELVNLRRIAEAAAGGFVDPVRRRGTEWIHETKEDIVENCLYGVDIQQQAIEICRLRLWLTLVVDYDLHVDPLEAHPSAFQKAIQDISQLPNLEMNFHRGDSLHDHICGVALYIEPGVVTQHRQAVNEIKQLGAKLHHARRSDTKKRLRITVLHCKLRLARQLLKTELDRLERRQRPLWKPDRDESGPAKLRRRAEEIAGLQKGLRKVQDDLEEASRLRDNPDAPDFYPSLRRLEGADFDSPTNFAWRLDFPAIFGREEPGFDIVVGNPPFVTARDPEKRALWRKRWPRVCYGHYHMLCPFIALSFGLLREDGELGFIVSNAFATREFGRPLVERFLPTVDLQKVVDCSGLMFPGHGTPTCIIFSKNAGPPPDSAVCVAGILPGGGDLRTAPEESPLWRTLELHHDSAGHEDARIAVAHRSRNAMAEWPWTFDPTAQKTRQQVEAAASSCLAEWLEGNIGYACVTRADDIYFAPLHLLRKVDSEAHCLLPMTVGDEVRNWSLSSQNWALFPYDETLKRIKITHHSGIKGYLSPFRRALEERTAYGRTQTEHGLRWFEYSMLFPERLRTLPILCFSDITTG